MFKTVDGELNVFNKTILSTQNNLKNLQTQTANLSYYTTSGNHVNLQNVPIAQPQTVSNFTKLNNAFKVYNGNLTKSTGLQNAYIKSVGGQNQALGIYLAGLNGAKASMGGYIASLAKEKLATIGLRVSTLALNIGLTVGITTLISGIAKMIGASEEMSQQASEATSKYKEQAASIDEYKNKITELKTALNDENISYSDARDKRSQLLDIQKQLIDTYGAEASGIDLVNGSLDDQIDKFETLDKQKRQEWENEVNKLSTGQQLKKWGGYLGLGLLDTITLDWSFHDANKWLEDFDNTTNIERITEKVENFKKSINLNDLDLDSEELEKLKSQLDSFNGVSFKGNKMTIAGDAKTVQDTITQIQTQVIGSREDLRSLDKDLKDVYNSAKKIVDANWDTYNTALKNQILDDKTGLEYYGKLTEAYETYQEAVKDGDENTINEAKEGYAKILSDIAGSDMSDSFKKFFENMYPDISDIVDDWKFEVEIVPKINANRGENELNNALKAVKNLTTEEISAAFENNGTGVTKDQWKAIADLNAEAQANGFDLTTFLEQLREAGYLVSQLDKDIEKAVNDTKNRFGKEEIKKQLEEFNKDDTIDFTIRPKVDTSELEKAGWGKQEPGTATVYSVTGYSEDYGLDAGKAVVVTPILPDGTVLSPEQVDEYIRKIFNGEKVDVDIKMGVFDGENYKAEADEFANTIHELHEKYFVDDVDWDKYFKDNSIDTQEEIDKWNEVTKGIDNAEDAMNAYDKATKNANKRTDSLEELNKQLDNIQSAYDAVSSAIEEYNENGYMSVDTYQKLLELAPEYMAMLIDENGNLTLTKDSWKLLTEAKIRDMCQTQANQYIESLKAAADSGNIDKLDELTQGYKNLSDAKIIDYKATLATLNLTDEQRAGAEAYLAGLEKAMNQTIAGLGKGGMGGSKSTKSSKDTEKSAKDKAKQIREKEKQLREKEKQIEEAWEKERLEQLKDDLEKRKNEIEKYKSYIETLDFGLDIVDEKDYSGQVDLLSQKYGNLVTYGQQLREEFTRVSQIVPKTADEANEIASRIQEIGSEMRNNVKSLRETYVEMQKIRIEALKVSTIDVTNGIMDGLDRALWSLEQFENPFNRNSKFIENVASFESIFDSFDELDKELEKRKRHDQALIAEEQATQDTINEIVTKSLEMQAEANAEARAEERAKLEEELAELSKEYKDTLDTASGNTADAQEKISEELATVVDSAEAMQQNVDTHFGNMETSVTTHVNNTIKKIDELQEKLSKFNPLSYNPNEKLEDFAINSKLNKNGTSNPLSSLTETRPFGGGTVKTKYGVSSSDHKGVDFRASVGTSVYAYTDGTVVSTFNQGDTKGYGK